MSNHSPQRSELRKNLLGIWKLVSRVDLDAAGRRHIDPVLGADPLGILCFSADMFAAQYMRRNRTLDPTNTGLVRGASVSSVWNGYDGHFGTYALDAAAGRLRVKLQGAISPTDVGREFERQVQVRGNQLIISLTVKAADGIELTRSLTFERLAACG